MSLLKCKTRCQTGFFSSLLGIHLDETNHTKFVEAFAFMHPWTRILNSINDFGQAGLYIRRKKRDKVQIYNHIIQPPLLQIEEDVRKITLWAVNILSGNLEQWVISENSRGLKQIECEIVEKRLIITLD